MDFKKIDIGSAFAEAGKAASNAFEKAKDTVVNAIDQNGDGELNLEDAAVAVNQIGNAVQNGVNVIQASIEKQRREQEMKTLRPIFA